MTHGRLNMAEMNAALVKRRAKELGADLVGMSTALEAIAAHHLGASVLGSVVAARATSVLPARLASAGVGPAMTRHALANAALVGQGLSVSRASAVIQASHAAFISGFHLALLIGSAVAFLGALTGPFIRRNELTEVVAVHL